MPEAASKVNRKENHIQPTRDSTHTKTFTFIKPTVILAICGVILGFGIQTVRGTYPIANVNNGNIAFVGDLGVHPHYILNEELLSGGKWLLGPYVLIAKKFILAWVRIDFDLIRSAMEADSADLMTTLMELVKMLLPILIISGIGLLLAIFTPLVAIIFACCRCCGKCGGKMTLARARKQNKCCCFTSLIILLIALLFLFVGAAAVYTAGNRMPKTADHITNITASAIEDTETFARAIFDEFDAVVDQDMDLVIQVFTDQVAGVGQIVAAPFDSEARPYFTSIMSGLSSITTKIPILGRTLSDITSVTSSINTLSSTLSTQISNLGSALDGIKADCTTNGVTPSICSDLPDSSDVPPTFNFGAATPDITAQNSLQTDLAALDFAGMTSTAQSQYDSIPSLIDTSASSTLSDLVSNVQDVSDSVADMIDTNRNSFDNLTSELTEIKDMISDLATENRKQVENMNVGVLIVASTVLFVVVVSLLGIVCGIVSYKGKPEKRGPAGNCAGYCLFGSCLISIPLVTIFLLSGTVLFIIGSSLTIGCSTLDDFSLFDEYLDNPDYNDGKYLLPDMLFGNGSIELSISDVLGGCRDNQAVYKALQLKHLIDLETQFNIDDELPDMSSLAATLSTSIDSVEVMDTATRNSVDNIQTSNAGAGSIDAAGTVAPMNSGMTSLLSSMATLRSKLVTAKAAILPEDASLATDYQTAINDVDTITGTTLDSLGTDIDSLEVSMETLDDTVDALLGSVGQTVTNVDNFQSYLTANAATKLMEGANTFTSDTIGFANQFISKILYRLNNDVGKCGAAWNIWNGLIGGGCTFFLDTLNAIWLSFEIIGIGLVLNVWFSVRLSKYFRVPEDANHYLQTYCQSADRTAIELERYLIQHDQQQARNDWTHKPLRPSDIRKHL